MNAPVAAQREGIDVRTLEQIFEHEAKCQSSHKTQKTCTHEVVAVKSPSCASSFLICAASYQYNVEWLETEDFDCTGCGNLASECWTIRPI